MTSYNHAHAGSAAGFGIKTKFLAMILLLFALFAANFFIMLSILETQRQDAFLINIAGRQRMLSQLVLKLVYQAMLERHGLVGPGPMQDTLKEIEAKRALFDGITHAMINGGEVADGLGHKLRIKKIESGEALSALEEMRRRWRLFEDILEKDINGDAATRASAFKRIEELELLGHIDSAVGILTMEAGEKVTRLRNVQLITLAFGIVLFVAVVWFFDMLVLRPVRSLVDTVMAVGEGDVGKRAEATSRDEIGFLTRSFNATMDNLEKTTVSRDFLDHVIKGIYESIIVTDKHRQIVLVNPATVELLGNADEKAIIGAHLDDVAISQPSKRNRRLFKPQAFEQLLDHGFIRDYNVAYRSEKTGEMIPVSFSARMLKDKNGGFDGLVCVARDMREYNMIQSTLIQSSKLAAIGTMSAGVAHELRNPLTVVKGKAQFLIFRLQGDVDIPREEIIRDMEAIIECADRMSSIVDHLRGFSRESKERDWTYLSIGDVIAHSLILFEKRLEQNGITLVKDVADGLPTVWGDRNKLISVFHNLLVNSFDAFGHVTDGREKTIRISARLKGAEALAVTFEDNASGMDKDVLDNVFTPFFTTKDVGRGTGLGLFILYGIIEEHGGNVSVSSTPGKGTTFTMNFRLDRKTAPEDGKAERQTNGQ